MRSRRRWDGRSGATFGTLTASSDVFISYARSDGGAAAQQIETALAREGLGTWRDARDLNPALDFTAEIEKAIESSSVVLVCVTPDVRRDDSFVRREIAYAQLCNRPVAVVRVAEVPPPISIVTNTFFELWRDWDAEVARLLRFCRTSAPVPSVERSQRQRYVARVYEDVVSALHSRVTLRSLDRSLRLVDLTGTVTSAWPTERSISPRFATTAGEGERIGLARFLRRSHDRLALLGEAGSGKTVTSMALARDLASEALTDNAAPVPVLLPATTAVDDDGKVRSLAGWLTAEVPILGPLAETLLAAGDAVLLVDGLDELPRVIEREGRPISFPRAEVLDELRPVPRLLVTSRPDAIPETDLQPGFHTVLRIDPLSHEQVTAYLAHHAPVSDEIAAQPLFISAARSPLFLSIIAALASADWSGVADAASVEEWRDAIFGEYVRQTFRRELERSPDGSAGPTVAELYRALGRVAIRDASFGGARNLFSPEDLANEVGESAGFLDLIERMGVVVRTRAGLIRFAHASLRDHFAYTEAARALEDDDAEMRDAAAWALWHIPDRRSVDLLVKALSDPYKYARGSAAAALGRIGDPRALPALRRLTSDKTEVVGMYGGTISEVATWAINEIERADEPDSTS